MSATPPAEVAVAQVVNTKETKQPQTTVASEKRKAEEVPASEDELASKKMKPDEKAKATESPAAPQYESNVLGMEKYHAAWASLRENTFVNDPTITEDDRIYRRGIQNTWRIQQTHRSSQGYGFQMMLVWDYDRIFGSFDLGWYKGVLMIDHGPRHEPPEDRESPIYYDFTWRATCTRIPDTSINNPLITKGKIEFETTSISGYFEGMMCVGLPGDRCDFEGKPAMGPRRVPRTIQSFIDEWNDHNIFGEDESPRLPPTAGSAAIFTPEDSGKTNGEDEEDEEGEMGGSVEGEDVEEEDVEDEDEDDVEDEVEEALWALSGLYTVTSDTVSAEWPDRAQSLTIRLQYDEEQDKVWGYVNMGISEGYLRSHSPLSDFGYGKPLKLDYRCREMDTGTSERGVAEVTFFEDNSIEGSFYGMYGGALGFEGKRKLMPSGISGRETWYYRQGWDAYGHHMNRWA